MTESVLLDHPTNSSMNKLLFFTFSLIVYSDFAFTQSAKLDSEELKALKEIWQKLGLAEKDWDFDVDPCSSEGKWLLAISCECYFESNTTCRIATILLSSQNVSTALPLEFTKLPYLQNLDLSQNYLSGTVPTEWATMRLNTLFLMGNRLSGPFPIALTRMTTLEDLSIEANRFSGPIPKDIANLKLLDRLALSSNDFTGPLPIALAKLTNLTHLRISDNNFTGKIPNFISQLTRIGKLHLQGCSFEGPFPSSISVLTELFDLRISDLKGGVASPFPPLDQMERLNKLVLRNCMINGTIPDYVGNMINLKTLEEFWKQFKEDNPGNKSVAAEKEPYVAKADKRKKVYKSVARRDLSFNYLTGKIPPSLSKLKHTEYIYLTANNLTGSMPRWVLSSTKHVDVSYNNFTWDDASGPKRCEQGTINVVESYSSSTKKQNNMHPCLRKDFPCTKPIEQQIHSLHINCGDEEVNINNTVKYVADTWRKVAYFNDANWAFSSTGDFIDSDHESDVYILSNTSDLHNISTFDTELYTKARTASVSLTYYGLCLMNGPYAVRLHFAEILFTQDNSFRILGKRVFNVYVQGELKLKDFDIAKEAGGTARAVIKSYPVNVKNNTLKIQLYWAGKGTTGIPDRGVYGPIISAISVDARFKPPKFGKKIGVRLIVGTVGGGLFFVFLIIVFLWRKGLIMEKIADSELKGVDLQTGIFTLRQIKAATKNFAPSSKLGEGGFGTVYKGLLSDGTIIAVKQLSSNSKQGTSEFVNEIGMLTALQHPNLVRLYGCCLEGNQMSLIYEYMENNCLSRALLGTDKKSIAMLTWHVRLNICIGIARGLVYLHGGSDVRIIHRDIKASNILLDENFNAKIADFGLAKLNDDENTHVVTRVAGTIGYMAPEYAMRGHLTPKADVYSFGILALEIVSGKSNNYRPSEEECFCLLDWAHVLQGKRNLLELVDPDLESEHSSEEALTILNVALLCTSASPSLRPTMSQTIDMLEGRANIQDFLKDQGTINAKNKALSNHFWQDHSETRPMSDEPCTESYVTELS